MAWFIKLSVLLLALATSVYAQNRETVRLASSSSLENSGLLDYLLPKFESRFPIKVEVRVVGSGRAMKLARQGKQDLIWVHAPESEARFMVSGYGRERYEIMSNDFLVVGPAHDPADTRMQRNVISAFKAIFSARGPFISRGDDSGTHKKELALWRLAGLDPIAQDWYSETGMSMSQTLAVGKEEHAYLLVDRATFIKQGAGALEVLVRDPVYLKNVYSVILVNSEKVPEVNEAPARRLLQWLMSDEARELIASYEINGLQLFKPKPPLTEALTPRESVQ